MAHNIGLPVMMIGLFFMIVLENQAFTPVVAVGATLTAIGVLIFVYHILKNLKSER